MSVYFDFNLDNTALNVMLNSPGGEVADDLRDRGQRVLTAARRDVGVRTGLLRSSLHTRWGGLTRIGPSIEIGSSVNYALVHHQGAAPHLIRAQHGRVLTFSRRGVRVYATKVFHPGTKPNKYLSGNLYLAVL